MTDTTKKAWFKPELIVLVRGKPEEGVLTACKLASVPGGPFGNNGWCDITCASKCALPTDS